VATPFMTLGRVSPLLARIRSEYEEMPGIRLTRPQFSRLCHADADTCESAIRILVTAGFLRQDQRGRFYRPTDLAA
jgi:hypothetical protein